MMTLNKRRCSKCQEGVWQWEPVEVYLVIRPVYKQWYFLYQTKSLWSLVRGHLCRELYPLSAQRALTLGRPGKKEKQTERKEQHSFLWELPQKLQTEGVKRYSSPLANAATKLSSFKSLSNNTHSNRCIQKPLFCFYYTNSLKKSCSFILFMTLKCWCKMLAEMSLESPTNGYGPWDATKDYGKGVPQERVPLNGVSWTKTVKVSHQLLITKD